MLGCYSTIPVVSLYIAINLNFIYILLSENIKHSVTLVMHLVHSDSVPEMIHLPICCIQTGLHLSSGAARGFLAPGGRLETGAPLPVRAPPPRPGAPIPC